MAANKTRKGIAGDPRYPPPDQTFRPTDEQREIVRALAAAGFREEEICLAIWNPIRKRPIDPKTLRKHFRAEIDSAHMRATANVFAALYRNATVHNNVAAQIFYLKARAGFREKSELDVTSGGKPVEQRSSGVVIVPGMAVDKAAWAEIVAREQAEAQASASERMKKLGE